MLCSQAFFAVKNVIFMKQVFTTVQVFPITLFHYQITPIDGERSGAMVCTVCGQEPDEKPNHTSLIMEPLLSRNDGIEHY